MDTVGFIRKPHELVKAFRATLEEARLADVLIMVLDGADAQMEGRRRRGGGARQPGEKKPPRVEAVNKCDLIAPEAQPRSISAHPQGKNDGEAAPARGGRLEAGAQEVRLLDRFCPIRPGPARLHAMGGVLEQRHNGEAWRCACA